MDKNQPNKQENLDPEYEKIKNLAPGFGDEPKEEETPKEDKQTEEKPKEDPKPNDGEGEDKDKDGEQDEEEEDEEEEDEETPKRPVRPQKYIPIKEYTDEKRKWKAEQEEKDRRIAELEKIANTTREGSQLSEEKIQAYAKKHNLDVEDAKAELERIRDAQDIFGVKPQEERKPADLSEEQKQALREADELKAEKAFEQEYNDVAMPELQKLFPTLTAEQKKVAKAEIEKIATSKGFLDKPLDFVIYKSRDSLAKLLKSPVAGPEGSRNQPSNSGKLTANDFKGGKTPFEKLAELPTEEQNKIIEDMDYNTYGNYSLWIDKTTPIVINRGGKKIQQN